MQQKQRYYRKDKQLIFSIKEEVIRLDSHTDDSLRWNDYYFLYISEDITLCQYSQINGIILRGFIVQSWANNVLVCKFSLKNTNKRSPNLSWMKRIFPHEPHASPQFKYVDKKLLTGRNFLSCIQSTLVNCYVETSKGVYWTGSQWCHKTSAELAAIDFKWWEKALDPPRVQ